MSQANKSVTDKEIEMMKKRYNDALQQERIAELEAENQRLNELLAIEKDVSEGALIANQLNFNVDKSANKSLNALVNHVMKANQELKDENQKLRDANRWIPVSERLPETIGRYQTTYKFANGDKEIVDAWFDGIKFPSTKHIAWREIPEPYQGDL